MFAVVLIGTDPQAHGQGYSGLGAEFSGGFGGGSGDGSRFPIRVKLSGTLNPTTPRADSIKLAVLSISGYYETYQLEIMQAEPVDDKQIPRLAIIPSIVGTNYDYQVLGTKDLLSKIGQSLPNTPITLVAFLRQRKSELILESVDTVRIGAPSSPERLESEDLPPISSADTTD